MDVYFEWIDACDAVAKEEAAAAAKARPPAGRQQQASASARAVLAPGERPADEDEGFIVDDEADAEAEYADE